MTCNYVPSCWLNRCSCIDLARKPTVWAVLPPSSSYTPPSHSAQLRG